MVKLPLSLKNITLFLQRLPGIGEKTANRLAFYFLKIPENDLQEFAQNIINLRKKTKFCPICFNLTENNLCDICADSSRDKSIITVIETVLDLLSFEQGNIYQGVYHVLHGKIDPLNRVGPDDIKIKELIERVDKDQDKIKEIIIATNPDMEGEATAMYIKEKIRNQISTLNQNKFGSGQKLKISRLAYGLPIGANLEYADYMTLKKSLEGRNEY